MNILITGAASPLARALVTELAGDHRLRLMERTPLEVEEPTRFLLGDLLDPDACWQAVRRIDAVVHTCSPPPDLPAEGVERDQMLLDLATRGTHNLFKAAVEAGVRRLLVAGTLAIFDAYPADFPISENWKPLPLPAMPQMAHYLAELTCREFARDYLVTVTCLRLGELVLEEEVAGQPLNPAWLDLRDAAHAFRCALQRDHSQSAWWTHRWAVYHIAADLPHPRFLIGGARQMGYCPAHRFSNCLEP